MEEIINFIKYVNWFLWLTSISAFCFIVLAFITLLDKPLVMALIMGIGCMIITMYLKIKKDYLLKLVIDDKITNFDFLFYANIALWIAIPCFVAAFVIPLLRMIRDTLMGGIS